MESNVNNDDFENSFLKTKKKSFISLVDPNVIKRKMQKETYIWYGVHNELLRNKNIIKVIKKCNDPSIPIECASIHLNNFKIGFNKNRVFIEYNENSEIFFKLYLITKEQFMDILITYYSCNNKIKKEEENIINNLNKINDEYDLNSYLNEPNSFYNIIKCVGNLDGIKILTISSKINEIIPPDIEYLKVIYSGLKKSFQPYNKYLIIYYIYLLEGVKNYYNIKQLTEVFIGNKNKNHKDNISSTSSQTNFIISENNQNKYLIQRNTLENLNNTPSQQIKKYDNDTIKCSTCNASPFMGTPEKEQLNKYSYIFDLHYLPIFDDVTGEFFWSNNESNWKVVRDSIIKSEEGNNIKSKSIFHGSFASISQSFNVKKDDINEVDNNIDGNSGTFIEELNNILKEIN